MRVDAGFVVGDEVSSFYDPMIAKLIVRGPDRITAIQKLHSALESYEIAGVVTNIDFIKRVCENEAFVSGDVETGFIKMYERELLKESPTPPEIFAQVALAVLAKGVTDKSYMDSAMNAAAVGFTDSFQNRQFHFKSGSQNADQETQDTTVEVYQIGNQSYNVKVGDQVFKDIRSTWKGAISTLTSFFPHTRFDTRIIFEDTKVTVFSHGSQYILQIASPKWMEKALGVKDLTHSVLAPMPCKVLRVDVNEGDEVKKDQALVVIESMKMETVIRSPRDGVVVKIVHKQGVSA